jgi:DNA polymerase-3 subunit delta'
MAKKATAKARGKARSTKPEVYDIAEEGEPLTPAPIGLEEVLGQDRAVRQLRVAIASGRVHHAWIFHGPKGVGKFTTALSFAAVLLDPTSEAGLGGEIEPDPESPVQDMLRDGRHPDLHVIRKELARYSDDAGVRGSKMTSIAKEVVETRLLKPAYLAPAYAGSLGARARKVFIVDEAHMLDARGAGTVQNSILKTLEEPPEGTVIILVTDSEERLLPTIRSRCQRIAFTGLDDAAMQGWIKQWVKGGGEVSKGDVEWLMAYAEGSPGRFAQAADAGLADWERALEPMLRLADSGQLSGDLGRTMAKLAADYAEEIVAEDKRRSKEAANREAAGMVFSVLATRARARLTKGDPEPALRTIAAIAEAEQRLSANLSIPVVFDWLAAMVSAGGPVRMRTG